MISCLAISDALMHLCSTVLSNVTSLTTNGTSETELAQHLQDVVRYVLMKHLVLKKFTLIHINDNFAVISFAPESLINWLCTVVAFMTINRQIPSSCCTQFNSSLVWWRQGYLNIRSRIVSFSSIYLSTLIFADIKVLQIKRIAHL